MKPFTLFLLIVACAFSLFAADPAPVVPSDGAVVTVYYFHRVNRCSGCRHAEAVTTEALKEHFAAEMEKGSVIFIATPVDGDKDQKAVAAAFDAFGPSLFLEVKRDGKTDRFELDKMWDKLREGDPAYKAWVAESVRKQL
jgi:VanZ family protein